MKKYTLFLILICALNTGYAADAGSADPNDSTYTNADPNDSTYTNVGASAQKKKYPKFTCPFCKQECKHKKFWKERHFCARKTIKTQDVNNQ